MSISIFGLLAAPAQAQELPNAGSLLRQLRQGIPDIAPQRAPAATAEAPTAPDAGPKIIVKGFIIEGNSLIPSVELEALLKARQGKEQSLGDLREAAQTVADAYRQRGYFARAYLPAQSVDEGIVRIRVVEGRFGKIVRKDAKTRARGAFVEDVVGSRLKAGEAYSLADLERGLLLANDLPGIGAEGALQAGELAGTSDLVLEVRDTPILSGMLGADNAGTRSTGEYRGYAGLALNNLSGYGDQLSAQIVKGARLTYGSAGWSVPLGADGWRAGVVASALRYRLGGTFKDIESRGRAYTLGADLSYPLIHRTDETMRVRATFDHARYNDDMLGEAFHRKRVNRGSVELFGYRSDDWGNGGLTNYRFTLTVGGVDLSRQAEDAALDAATARTDGRFAKLALDLQRDQSLGRDWFLRGHIAGQWTRENLDSSEKLSLGGPSGVRAYPINEGTGDNGLIANVELHRPVTQGWARSLDLYAFVDGGLVCQHAQRWEGWDAGADMDNVYPLFGAGVGANYTLPGNIGISLTAAVPIGSNRGSAQSGRNQDGSKTNPSVWLTATKTF